MANEPSSEQKADEPSLEHKMVGGFVIKAWVACHDKVPHVMVQWRRPNGQPIANPFMVPSNMAVAVFKELAAFSELHVRP